MKKLSDITARLYSKMDQEKVDEFIILNHKGQGGSMTLAQIAQGLQDAGFKTKRGDTWTKNKVDARYRSMVTLNL